MKSLKKYCWVLVLSIGFNSVLIAQEKEIQLWDKVPGSIKNKEYNEEFRLNNKGAATGIRKVTDPILKVFLVDNHNSKNAAVVICPGGGYAVLSHEKEGDKVAEWFNSIGISAVVLRYRLPSDIIMEDKTIGPLQDAQEAIRTLRRNGNKWNIDANKIGIIGFSAGGHLASTASTHYNKNVYASDETSARPDFSILIYPVISMKDGITHNGSRTNLLGVTPSQNLINSYSNELQVNSETPKTFLIHAADDRSVPVENSINYFLALKEYKVSAEMHIFQNGGHGFGLGVQSTSQYWPTYCENWLRLNKYIK